jgi:hypothetical protein
MNMLTKAGMVSLISLSFFATATSVLAQSLESLERDGLITSSMRKFLEDKEAFTPEKRVEVLDKACSGSGELSPQECRSVGRGRYDHYRRY